MTDLDSYHAAIAAMACYLACYPTMAEHWISRCNDKDPWRELGQILAVDKIDDPKQRGMVEILMKVAYHSLD